VTFTSNPSEVVQMFELRRVGGAPKGHPFAPLGSGGAKGGWQGPQPPQSLV